MRKIYILLVGLLLLIGCGGTNEPAEEFAAAPDNSGDTNESRGAEQLARPTPMPTLDKSFVLADSGTLTVTELITGTQPISTTVRGDAAAEVEAGPHSSRVYCSAAQKTTDNRD